MDPIPNSAIAMAIGLLIVIWAFFVHMIMSQAPDTHLEFFRDLVEAEEEWPESSPPRGSSPCLPFDGGTVTPHEAAQSSRGAAQQECLQPTRLDVPLLFATSLRGRGL